MSKRHILDKIVKTVSDQLPSFNEYLLKDFVENEVSKTPALLDSACHEAMKHLGGIVKYKGYEILNPKARAEHELHRNKGGVKTVISELILCRYDFIHDDKICSTFIYLPYLKDYVITIKGAKYGLQLGLIEKTFARTNEGILIRVMRSPLQFRRNPSVFRLEDVLTKDFSNEFGVMLNMHNRAVKSKRPIGITAIHYLMAKHGWDRVISMFNLSKEDIDLVDKINEKDIGDYAYYIAKRESSVMGSSKMVYIKAKRTILADNTNRKLIANLLYTMSYWGGHDVALARDPEAIIWRSWMGMIIFPNQTEAQAGAQANIHINSIDHYLDPLTRDRFHRFGIYVNDIYELIKYSFINMDELMANLKPQDLFTKQIDVIVDFMINTLCGRIMRNTYVAAQNPTRLTGATGHTKVMSMLRIPEEGISDIRLSQTVRPSPDSINGCVLLTHASSRVLINGTTSRTPGRTTDVNAFAPELRFNQSAVDVTSCIGFGGKAPGYTGTINPFITIDKDGAILVPKWAEDLEELQHVLDGGGSVVYKEELE